VVPDQVLVFDRLTPAQLLTLLAELAQVPINAAQPQRSLLDQAIRADQKLKQGKKPVTPYMDDVYLFPGQSNNDLQLCWPDPAARRPKPSGEWEKVINQFIDSYKKLKGAGHRVISGQPRPDEAMSMQQALPWLLINASDGNRVSERTGEYLLATETISLRDAAEIKETLDSVATSVRVVCTEPDASGQMRFCFHVLADEKRLSLFDGTASASFYPHCFILHGFEHGERLVFVPRQMPVGFDALQKFCDIVEHVPSLYESAAPADNNPLLAAILPAVPEGHFEMLYLAHLELLDGVQFFPKSRDADFHISSLQSSAETARQLMQAIEDADPHWGYRLEIRTLGEINDERIQNEKDSLSTQLSEIEFQLAYLESLQVPRPRLLRFTQAQLPDLADFIRCFPQKTLASGVIKYAFQANDKQLDQLECYHYLYVLPEAKGLLELESHPLWTHLGAGHIKFRLDPFWASEYYEPDNRFWVFTPEGTALFPAMHDWSASNMDAYLRECMGRWFHGAVDVAQLPKQPVYVFDQPDGGSTIQVTVLDFEKFQPLEARLGWMNDNLAVMHEVGGVEELITQMAAAATRRQLADCVGARAEAALQAFDQSARATNDAIAKETAALTDTINTMMDALLKSTQEHAALLNTLNQRLAHLQVEYRAMQDFTNPMVQLAGMTDREVQSLQQLNGRLEKEIERSVQESQNVRKKVAAEVEPAIQQLRQTSDQLTAALYRAFRGGS
jgi:hypothetical protein